MNSHFKTRINAFLIIIIILSGGFLSPQQRNPVLEYSAGTWCQWCPCGDIVIEQISSNMPNAIFIGYHGPANGSDPFSFFTGNEIISLLTFQAYPTGIVDRTSAPIGRESWPSVMNNRNSIPATVGITTSGIFNPTIRELNISIQCTALQNLQGDYRMSLILLEDSLVANQMGNGSCPGSTYYIHDNVVRSMINGAEGEVLISGTTWQNGTTITKNIQYGVSTNFKVWNCRLVVLVYKTQIPPYNSEIQQAEQYTLQSFAPEPPITVTTPNGFENWQVYGTYDIMWTSTGINNVKIDFTTNNGVSWLNIIPSTPSDGIYSWTVPNTQSIHCKMRITDVNNTLVYDISDQNFKILYHIPVIVIPGIMGSPLFNDLNYDNHLFRDPIAFQADEYVWTDVYEAAANLTDNFLDVLRLSDDGITPAQSNYNIQVAPLRNDNYTTINNILTYLPFNKYNGLISNLVTNSFYKNYDFDYNSSENEDLYIFTYDWRKSCSENANNLSILVDSVCAWNTSDKVNLICHSMGGLIAKKYLQQSIYNKERINKLIFIGTPHQGAPQLLYVMLRGKLDIGWFKDLFFYDKKIRQISRNMQSTYELMPALNYSNLNINTGIRWNKSLYSYYLYTPQFGNTDYFEMMQFFNGVVLPENFTYNSNLNINAHYIRSDIEDVDLTGVEVYNIAGYDKPTVGKVEVKEGWWGLGEIDPDKTEGIKNLSGDGTVPLRSAEIVNLEKRIADYYIREVEHSELPSSAPVIELITNLLKEPATTTYNHPAISTDPPLNYAAPGIWQIDVSSPVELHAYDLFGNHTGPTSDSTWEELIPGSEYFPGDLRIPHSKKSIIIPEGTEYRFQIISQDTAASFDLILHELLEGVSNRSFIYDSVVTFENTEAKMEIMDTSNIFGLNMDYDGNGIIDSIVLPTLTNYCMEDSISEEWNIVALPYLMNQELKTELYPTAASNAYWFNGSYIICDNLEPRRGYWIKFDAAFDNIMCGEKVLDTIHINSGWNMIGCFNKDVPVSNFNTEPPGILTSNCFGYSGGYFIADTLRIGKGYWIKSNSNGIIHLNQNLSKIITVPIKVMPELGTITIFDSRLKEMKLYSTDGDITDYQLPPQPPSGAFDIRFESGTMAEDLNNSEKVINISGASYPITIKVNGLNISVQDLVNGNILNQIINDGGEIIIYDNRINKILIKGENQEEQIMSYSLEQNYPNPFNPNTVIKFTIANEVNVNLSVFNILGERVAELKNEMMKPGYYEVEFNAADLASGIYLYRIKAGDFVETKKMVLIK